MLYLVAIAVHVVVAVIGIGLVGAIPLTARFARQAASAVAGSETLLSTLLRATQIGFFLMVLTGVLLDVSVGGAFHRTGWFMASVGVLPFIGISHARARRALGKGFSTGGSPDVALRRVEHWGWIMCAAVALVTVLMQVKPLP
jgi:hypothetical protein